MLYVATGSTNTVIRVRDSDDDLIEEVSFGKLVSIINMGIKIYGVDSLFPLVLRQAKKKPFFYDYCIANDLVDFLSQWNDACDAKFITIGDKRSINWRCKYGHTWSARLDARVRYNQGCPYCVTDVYKGHSSFSEQRYLYYLKQCIPDIVGLYKIGNWEVDMFSKALNLIIEYDGRHHSQDRLDTDIRKTKYLQSLGFRVVRIREFLSCSFPSICDVVVEVRADFRSVLNSLINLLGIDYIFDFSQDKTYEIYSSYRQDNKNSVLVTDSDVIAKYYDYSSNNYDLNIISRGSDVVAVWKCELCGKPYSRTFHQVCKGFTSCDSCKDLKMLYSRIAKYGGSLKEFFPELEPLYDSSNKYPFDALTKSTNQIIALRCPVCDKVDTVRCNRFNNGKYKCSFCGFVVKKRG